MKAFWHIGPHKTGTTALQIALREYAASKECRYFYPAPSLVEHLGHAQIAWRFLGLGGCTRDPAIMLRKVAAADKAGFDKVVFSSEEFSRAIFVDDGFESFARFCEQVDCELVITLSPLGHRIMPELQEAVKHGESFEPDNLEDLMRLCAARPGLRPDFLSSAILGVKARSVSVIHVDKNDPEKIYRAMSTVIGEPLPVPASAVANRSSPFMNTVWLSSFNKYFPDVPWETSRALVDTVFKMAAKDFAAIEHVRAPPLPTVFVDYISDVWESQLKFLAVMQDGGRLRCF